MKEAVQLFAETEGIDIEPAAGVAVASLRQALEEEIGRASCRERVF